MLSLRAEIENRSVAYLFDVNTASNLWFVKIKIGVHKSHLVSLYN